MLTAREQQVLKLRQQGLTQEEIAGQLGVSQSAISGFERNAKRKIRDAQATIATAERLGVSPDGPLPSPSPGEGEGS